MTSQLTEAMIVNGVVLATVLATDLGPARKISRSRSSATPPSSAFAPGSASSGVPVSLVAITASSSTLAR